MKFINYLKKLLRFPLLFCWPIFIVSCATVDFPIPAEHFQTISAENLTHDKLLWRHSPVFIIEESHKKHNRIGTPSARFDEDGEEEIYINVDLPTIYYVEQPFTTGKDKYLNLVYRVHFEKVPFSIFPFHLTTGNNVGLIVVVTLNRRQQPVLITTVNTCGCYLSLTATSYTPEEAFPQEWNHDQQQWIYGEYLPIKLHYNDTRYEANTDLHPVLLLRSHTHRVKDLWLDTLEKARNRHANNVMARLLPMEKLEKLPLNGSYTSFYDTEGSRKGYVKNSQKPWERLFMSWWAFDWRIGEDKIYGPAEKCNSVFYTSIKFWDRQESNMWNFAEFLDYWGWNF